MHNIVHVGPGALETSCVTFFIFLTVTLLGPRYGFVASFSLLLLALLLILRASIAAIVLVVAVFFRVYFGLASEFYYLLALPYSSYLALGLLFIRCDIY